MAHPHDPRSETPRDSALGGEIARDENVRGAHETVHGVPEIARGAPEPSRTAAGSVRVTADGITEVGFDDPELRPLPADKLHYHVPHPDPHPEAHEHSDVPIRPLVVALAAIAITCLVSFGLLYWVYWRYHEQQRAQEIKRTDVPMAKSPVPEPRLQGVPGFSDNHPTQDMQQMRDRYRAELTSYGKSADGAAAKVPIDRAMELALERKMFPVSAGAAGKAADTGPLQQQQAPQQQQAAQSQQQAAQSQQQQLPQPRSPERGRGQQ